MAMQAIFNWDHVKTPWSSLSLPSSSPLMFAENIKWKKEEKKGKEKDEGSGRSRYVCAASSSNSATPSPNYWDWWKPDKGAPAPCLSDILWPSAGAFAAMAILGKVDQLLSPKGLSMTIAPLGAVSAVLFATPNAPGARKYNIFVAQMGCAAIGVLALSAFGPGWLARSAALGASIGFMIWTRSVHPPAASLPILFIDGSKFHRLHLWYALFPGAAGCILLCLIDNLSCMSRETLQLIRDTCVIQKKKNATADQLLSPIFSARDGVLLEGQLQVLSGRAYLNLSSKIGGSRGPNPMVHFSTIKDNKMSIKLMIVLLQRF